MTVSLASTYSRKATSTNTSWDSRAQRAIRCSTLAVYLQPCRDCQGNHSLHAERNPAGWIHSLWHCRQRRPHAGSSSFPAIRRCGCYGQLRRIRAGHTRQKISRRENSCLFASGSAPHRPNGWRTAGPLVCAPCESDRRRQARPHAHHDLGDWNDGVVAVRVPEKLVGEVREQGESVLNAAMASYVLDYYARMLTYAGDKATASEAQAKAEGQRQAVQANWSGRWFRRAWLGPNLGWIGEDRLWLEPQPWAIIGGAATPGQRETLVAALDELVRRPSPIGAMILNQANRHRPSRTESLKTEESGPVSMEL